MRVAIIGTGGVGGYFGGRLAQAGNEVTFLARGKHLAALARDGLDVQSSQGDFKLPRVTATDQIAEIGQVDLVLVCVKTWQVAEVAPQLAPLVGPNTIVVPTQNGVEAADQLAAGLGKDAVAGGTARIIAFVDGPGKIRHLGVPPIIEIGALQPAHAARVKEIVATFDAAPGVTCKLVDDITAASWKKFLFVAGWGALGALARAPVGPLRSVPATRELLLAAMTEIQQVGAARGVKVTPEDVQRAMTYFDGLPPEGTTSLQRDLAAGVPSELEAWSGAVVRLGKAAGVPTPVHAVAYGALLPSEQRARKQLSF